MSIARVSSPSLFHGIVVDRYPKEGGNAKHKMKDPHLTSTTFLTALMLKNNGKKLPGQRPLRFRLKNQGTSPEISLTFEVVCV